MAGFVVRREGCEWSSANWIFWGFMDHLISSLTDDLEAIHRLEGCKWMQLLSVPMLEEEDAPSTAKILDAARVVATRCLRGELLCSVDGVVLDKVNQNQFKEAMKTLVSTLQE